MVVAVDSEEEEADDPMGVWPGEKVEGMGSDQTPCFPSWLMRAISLEWGDHERSVTFASKERRAIESSVLVSQRTISFSLSP